MRTSDILCAKFSLSFGPTTLTQCSTTDAIKSKTRLVFYTWTARSIATIVVMDNKTATHIALWDDRDDIYLKYIVEGTCYKLSLRLAIFLMQLLSTGQS